MTTPSDLPQRLRDLTRDIGMDPHGLISGAAKEIERLRATTSNKGKQMKFEDYQDLAHCTESPVNDAMRDRFAGERTIRLMHAAMGMCTEAGEFQDQLKRHLFYGKPLDDVNLAEEVGDLLWYCALAANALGVNLADVAEKNIAKLRARYPDKFTEHDALNRNLDNERRILES
jgi:NTP pyrophosphatase (non-canonical NTP hydrolase)